MRFAVRHTPELTPERPWQVIDLARANRVTMTHPTRELADFHASLANEQKHVMRENRMAVAA